MPRPLDKFFEAVNFVALHINNTCKPDAVKRYFVELPKDPALSRLFMVFISLVEARCFEMGLRVYIFPMEQKR